MHSHLYLHLAEQRQAELREVAANARLAKASSNPRPSVRLRWRERIAGRLHAGSAGAPALATQPATES